MLQKKIKQCVQEIENTVPSIANGNAGRWTSRTTIAFPAEWPMKSTTGLVIYGYVYRHPERGADFEEQCGPFCRVVRDAVSDALRGEKLPFDISHVFRQGVRPVMKNEIPDYERLETMLSQPASESEIKSGYRFWLQQNSALAEHIAPHHQAFFDWLES